MKSILIAALFYSTVSSASATFSDALKEIVGRSTGVGIEKGRVDVAQTVLLSKRLAFLPTLTASATQSDSYEIDPNYPTYGLQSTLSNQVQGTLNLNLFKSGADLAALNAAASSRDYEKSQLDQTVLTIESDGVLALVEYLESKLTLDILSQNVDYTHELSSLAELRYKRGLLAEEELARLQIDQSNDEADLIDARTRFNSARARLQSLLGSEDILPEWPWKTVMMSSKVNTVLNHGVRLDDLPAYRSATFLIESSDETAKSYYRSMFPRLDLSYSSGEYKYNVEQWQTGWSTMVTLTIPLFNGYADYASYKSQDQKRLEAELQLEQLRRDQTSEQKLEQENFRLALATAQSRDKTLMKAQKLLKTNMARFKSGRMDANDLSVERTRESRASILAVQGWSKAHQALLKLFQAYGQSVQEL